MATTDAKPGFRLPWSADRSESEDRAESTDVARGEALHSDQEIETPDMIDAAAATEPVVPVDEQPAVSEADPEGDLSSDSTSADATPVTEPAPSVTTEPAAGRKPNKFMVDLTRAMQGAAETAKADTLARFIADAKAHIETIHASTALEATELRKQADDDVASIREWSKAEIARIREETDERITHRKSRLEREIEAHAADIEGRIERVQRRVDAFEAEMADFFQRLIAEEDATRFAAMAESLPEPPPFDDDSAFDPANIAETAAQEPVAEEHVADLALVDATNELPAERAVVVEPWPEARAEESADTVGAADASEAPAAASEAPAAEAEGNTSDETAESNDASDPRLEALTLVPDFAAAEAEAAEFTPDASPAEEEIAVIGDDALAARLAGLVPDAETDSAEATTTRVVVTGLVSVASIAGFKRQLSRVPGVLSVGVSSGPDGEFLFAVSHSNEVVLRDAITTLPGFGARVTAEADGELTVTAKDPEAEG